MQHNLRITDLHDHQNHHLLDLHRLQSLRLCRDLLVLLETTLLGMFVDFLDFSQSRNSAVQQAPGLCANAN